MNLKIPTEHLILIILLLYDLHISDYGDWKNLRGWQWRGEVIGGEI